MGLNRIPVWRCLLYKDETSSVYIFPNFLHYLHICIYKSSIRPCIEYYCHIRSLAPDVHLDILDKIKEGPIMQSILTRHREFVHVSPKCEVYLSLYLQIISWELSDEPFSLMFLLQKVKLVTRLASKSHLFYYWNI